MKKKVLSILLAVLMVFGILTPMAMAAPLPTPTGLAANPTASTISWNAVPGATVYNLNINGTVFANVTSPFTASGWFNTPGDVLTITLTAVDGTGVSTDSTATLNFTVPYPVPTIAFNPAPPSPFNLAPGATQQLSVALTNNFTHTPTWTSSNTNVATVSASGLVTATNTAGTSTITAAITTPGGTRSVSTVVTVSGVGLTITGANPTVPLPLGTGAANRRTLTASFDVPTGQTAPNPNQIIWIVDTSATPLVQASFAPSSLMGRTLTITAGNVPGSVTLRAQAPRVGGGIIVSEPVTIQLAAVRNVVFNRNGGTFPTTNQTHTSATDFTAAMNAVDTPRRLGYTFNGWWTTATPTVAVPGVRIEPSTLLTSPDIPATGTIQLFARWTAAPNTTAVPANSTIGSIFPDANLATRVAASLAAHFNTTVNANTQIRVADLAQLEVLNLTRPANQPIVDLRGITTLEGVTSVTPANGLTNQAITLPAVTRSFPLDHENVVRNRDGAFVNPATISNSGAVVAATGAQTNSTIRWTTVPVTAANVTYTWNVPSVQIGTQTLVFSGTATLPFRVFNFIDVPQDRWFYAPIRFVFEQGIMEGYGNQFFPDRNLTRAEFALTLYRMAGSPSVTGLPPFSDVTAAWQRDAVTWASSNGIVTGYQGRFRPNETITREEFAAMLQRFAAFRGNPVGVPGTANLNNFPDGADVSNWALNYMRWATHTGKITGVSPYNYLNPTGTTTRAECATMLQRYVNRFGA